MIWLQPLAWIGIIAVAIPIVLHLRDERHPRAQRFPSLRFLGDARPVQMRRTRLTELLLLAVRIAILAAAVAALAQPLWSTTARPTVLNAPVARAVIVDTSASMSRATTGGTASGDARREAARIASDASTAVVVPTHAPASALAGAGAWADLQPGLREIVVVSDFQTGTVDGADVARVPQQVGLRFVRIDVAQDTTASAVPAAASLSRVGISNEYVDAEWNGTRAHDSGLVIRAGPASARGVTAAREAARSLGDFPVTAGRAPVIVYPDYPARAALLRGARRIDTPWMGDVVLRLRADPALASVARGARATDTSAGSAELTVVTRGADGAPLLSAAQTDDSAGATLTLFAFADAGSIVSAAVIAAATRAAATELPPGEYEPASISDSVLRRRERMPASHATTIASRADTHDSDGRWVWLLVLVLLGVETYVRRTQVPRA